MKHTSAWHWGPRQRKASKEVKRLLQSSHVLTHFNDQLPLILECDASPYGVGAVLSHEMLDSTERPICFTSRTLLQAERNYSHLDKEALAIIFGVKRFHQYLFTHSFIIKTDDKPLPYIFDEARGVPTMVSGRIQRWALMLGAYQYTIRYWRGSANANADALSRLPLPTKVCEVPQPPELVHLMEHLSSTPLTSIVIKRWTDRDSPSLWSVLGSSRGGLREKQMPGAVSWDHTIGGGGNSACCVLWGCGIVIPGKGREMALQPHDPPVVPLHSWSWPETRWSRIHIDYVGPFEGKMFLLMADPYSKWLEIQMTNSTTSLATIEALRKSFSTFGLPEIIVSDNATAFTSSEFSEFVKKNGIHHIFTPPYHPASNGLVKRAVQTFTEGMRRNKEGSLTTRLSRFLFRYRLTPHSTTGVPPSELIFGRKLRSPLDLLKPSIGSTVQQAQDRQKKAQDSHASPRTVGVGDNVYA